MRAASLAIVVLLLAGCSSPAAVPSVSPSASSGAGSATGAPSAAGGSASGTVIVTTSAAGTPQAPAPPVSPAEIPKFGIAFSPLNTQGENFSFFFRQAQDTGRLVLWGGDESALADSQGPADVIASLSANYGLTLGIQVGVYDPAKPFDATRQQKAMYDITGFVTREKPAFVILGPEINVAAEKDPAFFHAFAGWYNATYDAIKNDSPSTWVFPSFQLEHMKGLTGGLYGGPEKSPEEWSMLGALAKRDITAFTTYPCMIYVTPNAMPSDYYASVADHVGGPVAFSEAGWFAAGNITGPNSIGWGSSPQEQSQFLQHFLNDTAALKPAFRIWLHLYDQPQVQPTPFQSMGLVNATSAKRPAYDDWISAVVAG